MLIKKEDISKKWLEKAEKDANIGFGFTKTWLKSISDKGLWNLA